MGHRIYGPPKHSLERVLVSLVLPNKTNARTTSVAIEGVSSTKRSPLWRYNESWAQLEHARGLEPVDVVRHVLLVAFQDKPSSGEQLERCLRNGGQEETLPLF